MNYVHSLGIGIGTDLMGGSNPYFTLSGSQPACFRIITQYVEESIGTGLEGLDE
jgi:hypothetical protein